MAKERLDRLLVTREFCESRQKAQRLIRAGEVKVNDQVIDKPGILVNAEAPLTVVQPPPYVSRGGEKLAKALSEFDIAVTGRICLDGGISTGGFTDCLLKAGAKQVYGVDVGYGQVAWQLRQDQRVILKERTNLRYLEPEALYGNAPYADFAVLDLSFISLTKVLAPLWALLTPPREAVLLVKPQFEVGRDRVGEKGVVRSPQDHNTGIAQVITATEKMGWTPCGLTWSPIRGPAGNIEYLLWLNTGLSFKTIKPLSDDQIYTITTAACEALNSGFAVNQKT
ncbi:MAG: TlyA family rRNA (cytidine-2'-O)-methyltransferase [Cyanobacteria bacterium SW_9_44_58]|nr:MAG: TlyA family rRNA (cytidine-2'-O)-methyltransferase [Cyanobacteria bacterium SW_9_44_58]